jgi:hypothetical protein
MYEIDQGGREGTVIHRTRKPAGMKVLGCLESEVYTNGIRRAFGDAGLLQIIFSRRFAGPLG